MHRAAAILIMGAAGTGAVACDQPGAASTTPWSLTGPSGQRMTRATVWNGEPPEGRPACADATMIRAGAMYRAVHGIAAVLESRDLRALAAATSRAATDRGPDPSCPVVYTVSLCGESEVRRIGIMLCPDGSAWCREVTTDGPADPCPMDRDRLAPIVAGWSWYTGSPESSAEGADRPPETMVLKPPYFASSISISRRTISERFLGGRSTRLDPSDRALDLESLHVRIPRGYSPRRPTGLIVWVDAGDSGEPPGCMDRALDEGNLIAAGFARCGNTRAAANRYQLALDAVETVARRYHVDRSRVYISGISGGGRIASIMQACFPDVFAGAIPMAGLSCSEPLPAGSGRVIPPAYTRPQGRVMDRLRTRRIAPITGARDFNQAEINAAAQILRAQGVDVRVFDHVDMGHELPTPERFSEALAWVDEPWRTMWKEREQRGERELRATLSRLKAEGRPRNDADRTALMRITEVAPWTSAAWRAIDLLDGHAPGGRPSPP